MRHAPCTNAGNRPSTDHMDKLGDRYQFYFFFKRGKHFLQNSKTGFRRVDNADRLTVFFGDANQ
jgi:hypothetical protein